MFGKKHKNATPLADSADKHILYEKSVQSADFELDFFAKKFKSIRKRKAASMREDFCGTAHLSVEWCRRNKENTAIGVDWCKDTLAWGQQHNIEPAGAKVASRISIIHDDVLKVSTKPVDFVCAMNFSYCIFKDRDTLRKYFKNVLKGLKKDGVLFLDLLGGTETIDITEEDREIEDENFTYVWEQESFNPINNNLLCHIHFDFEDGSRLEKAFTYDWRLWSLPELQEILLEAGFKNVRIFWEEYEEDPDDPDSDELVGTGKYKETKVAEQQESWLAYIAAEK